MLCEGERITENPPPPCIDIWNENPVICLWIFYVQSQNGVLFEEEWRIILQFLC